MYINTIMRNGIISKLPVAAAVIFAVLIAAAPVPASDIVYVSSFDDLRKIGRDSSYPIDGEYVLVRDIDASDSRVRPFEPIGTFAEPFSGKFHSRAGETFVIRNLYINRPASGHAGLFGVLRYDAHVSNVGVEADTVIGHFAVGTLAGTNNGRISNCYGTGVVIAHREQSNAGGLVGASTGDILGSYAAASVDGRENVGGLVGLITADGGGVVSQSFAGGSAAGTNNVGGLVGHAFGGSVSECFSFAYVSGKNRGSITGGLIGRDFATSALWNERGITFRDSAYVRAAEVSGSYWDLGASRQAQSAGGEGKRRAELMSLATFAGWDFDGVWSIVEGVHYPHLTAIPLYVHTLSYAVDSSQRGRLRVLNIGADSAGAEAYSYSRRQMLGTVSFSVEALPWDGYRFVRWSDGRTEPLRADTAFEDLSLVARFERVGGTLPSKTFSYTADNGGSIMVGGLSGKVSGTGEIAVPGGALGPAVAAVPDSGYRFVMWSDGFAGVVRTDRAEDNLAVTAYFVKDGRAVIKLSDSDDLLFLARGIYPLDGSYELAGDIDLSENKYFEPIGTARAPFKGVFRGDGHRIYGLNMNHGDVDSGGTGFFGYTESAHISGLNVETSVVGVTGVIGVGLIAGIAVNTIIDSCTASGTLRGAWAVGGIAGYTNVALISGSASSALVYGWESDAGGIVGQGAASFITLCQFTGILDGGHYVGGLAGRFAGGMVQHSYSSGSVNGRGTVGGLAGELSGGAKFLSCYSSGSVIGTGISAGGLAGTLGSGGATAVACFWDIPASGRTTSALGIGKTSAQMKSRGTYAGWDFDDVWDMNDGRGYPWLRIFPPPPLSMLPDSKQNLSLVSANAARVKIRGRVMRINAPAGTLLRVRLIDMRGRVAAGYDASGGMSISLRRVPAGKYVVETTERGKPKNISTVILR